MKNRKAFGSNLCCLLGICGAAACSIAMFAVPLGLVGASVAAGAKAGTAQSMAGMPGTSDMSQTESTMVHAGTSTWVTLLNRYGPELLVASVLLMVIALAVRRSVAGASAAVLGGIVLFYGMYGQSNMTVMWSATILGMLILLASMFGLRRLPLM